MSDERPVIVEEWLKTAGRIETVKRLAGKPMCCDVCHRAFSDENPEATDGLRPWASFTQPQAGTCRECVNIAFTCDEELNAAAAEVEAGERAGA